MIDHDPAHFDERTLRNANLIDLGAIAMAPHELETVTETTPEISTELAATYVDKQPDQTYLVLCGDDRELTEESREELAKLDVADPDTAIRYYGGAIGVSKVTAVAVVAQHGPEILEQFDGGIGEFNAAINKRTEGTNNVILATHSAEANEGNPAVLASSSELGLGCAYGALEHAVADLNSDPAVLEVAKSDKQRLSGSADSTTIETVAEANASFRDRFFKADKGLSRDDFHTLGSPTGIVRGAHAKVADTSVVINFHPNKVSNPRAAAEIGQQSYNNDVTQVAEMILRANPELSLDPRVLLDTMITDIAATRAALASGEGLSADDLKLLRYGDYEEAVSYLESIAA
jgi:hypothetical protein